MNAITASDAAHFMSRYTLCMGAAPPLMAVAHVATGGGEVAVAVAVAAVQGQWPTRANVRATAVQTAPSMPAGGACRHCRGLLDTAHVVPPQRWRGCWTCLPSGGMAAGRGEVAAIDVVQMAQLVCTCLCLCRSVQFNRTVHQQPGMNPSLPRCQSGLVQPVDTQPYLVRYRHHHRVVNRTGYDVLCNLVLE